MTDRNIVYPNGNTIFWDDFIKFVLNDDNANITDMGVLLNRELLAISEDGGQQLTTEIAYLPRSIIKLQALGALQYDFVTTLGNSSPNFINRFHVTFFGQKLLEYIGVENPAKHDSELSQDTGEEV
jgi:hypothetical protein